MMGPMDTLASKTGVQGISTSLSADTMYQKCLTLAKNLWWTWQPDVINLFRELDPIRWRQLDHNPVALLSEITPERLEIRISELSLHSRINQAYRRLKEYLSERPLWARTNAGVLGSKPVAYFSLEYGIHESVPIYSGGLGVLSGDHCKSASDLGVPLVAVGLFYDQGYFKQHLNHEGWQEEEYIDVRVEKLPLELATDEEGNPIVVQIETRTGVLRAKVWLMRVGRVSVYLLDTDVEGNSPEDRDLTSRLYGGDNRTRIRQELVAGVGGVRALRAVGIKPGVYHLNEGHSAFAVLEVMRERMMDDGLTFHDAFRETAHSTVFTTHTPVPAGHDRFDGGLIEEHLGPLRDALGISHDQLMGLGRVNPNDGGETFCMTAGPEVFAQGQRRQRAARSRHAQYVVAALQLADRGRGADRAHHQRRSYSQLVGLADEAALRPLLLARLVSTHGRTGGLAGDFPGGSGRIVGNAPDVEDAAHFVRPPPHQSPVPPARGTGRSHRNGAERARPHGLDDRVRKAFRDVQESDVAAERRGAVEPPAE